MNLSHTRQQTAATFHTQLKVRGVSCGYVLEIADARVLKFGIGARLGG